MDKILRDTMFAGLTDREIAEAIGMEIRRRGLVGCFYMIPMEGGPGVFSSSSPAETLCDMSVSEQLAAFSGIASVGSVEHMRMLPDEDDTSFDPWVN